MTTGTVELAFSEAVDLTVRCCDSCGFVLGLSTRWVGYVADDHGVPALLVWHLGCAPRLLREREGAT